MIKNITYEDKASIQNDESVARKNKVTDTDMNEIKEVVNANADGQITMQKDITNIKAKDTEQDSKIVELQTEKAELEKELKEAQEDFYQNSIRGQASGEYIHVEDSSNCRARIGIGGNHEQETREGYNLLSASKQYTYTNGNVKLASDGIGKYTMNGDGTSKTEATKYTFTLKKEYTIKNNDYLHIMNEGTKSSNAALILIDNNDEGIILCDLSSDNRIENLSNYAGKTIKGIQLYMNPIKVDITLTPMIINNVSTAKNFEQYGAMPSPDYPSEIKTVGSNVNLFDKDDEQYILKNMFIDGASKKISSYTGTYSIALPIKPNTTYTIYRGLGTKDSYRVATSDNNVLGPSINNLSSFIDTKYYTIKTSNESKYLIIWYYWDSKETYTEEEIRNSIKIVEGTEIGEYSPYGQGCINEVICNKNLFNISKRIYLSIAPNTVNVSLVDGKLTASSSSSSAHSSYLISGLEVGKKYTVSWKNATNFNSIQLSTSDSNGTAITQIFRNYNTTASVTFEATSKYYQLIILSSTSSLSIENVQIEEGTTATPYEQHEEQSYIMPVQKEMLEGDYFDYDNEEEVHVWGKVVLSGAETIVAFSLTDTRSVFYVKIDGMYVYKDKNSIPVLISDEFKVKKQIETWKVGDISRIIERPEYVALILAAGYTLDTFKEWLATNKPKVYYKLAEPIRLKFTDEQKAVAKELNNARTYKNVTNITTDSIAIIDLDYAKDLETLLNNTQALAVNNASEGV